MLFWQYIFWVSSFIIFYNYAGYAIPLYFINKLKKKIPLPQPGNDYLPTISFIVAAYNEEECIGQKAVNSLEQDYPAEKIELIFVTDGSTDASADIIAGYPAIRLLHSLERMGKSAAIERAVQLANHEILIFSDANTFLNKQAVRNIARHYRDPKVGGIAGEKKVIAPAGNSDEVGAGEGLYWKYESFLKRLDSAFYSVVGAAGELFSLRKNLYEPLPSKVILDDFVISLRVAQRGYRVLYEPEAYAMELPSFSLGDEQKRKVRIAAGGFQAMGMLTPLLAFWRHWRLSYLYISHRVLRWTLSPLCMILAFMAAIYLAIWPGGALYGALLTLQCLFYGTAATTLLYPPLKNRWKIPKLIYYFVFMNVSVILGFVRFLRGSQSSRWEKARRLQVIAQSE